MLKKRLNQCCFNVVCALRNPFAWGPLYIYLKEKKKKKKKFTGRLNILYGVRVRRKLSPADQSIIRLSKSLVKNLLSLQVYIKSRAPIFLAENWEERNFVLQSSLIFQAVFLCTIRLKLYVSLTNDVVSFE